MGEFLQNKVQTPNFIAPAQLSHAPFAIAPKMAKWKDGATSSRRCAALQTRPGAAPTTQATAHGRLRGQVGLRRDAVP